MSDLWIAILPGIELAVWTAKNALLIYVITCMSELLSDLRRKQ